MSDLPIRLMPFLVPCIVLYYWFSYPCGVYRVCEEIRHGGSPAGAWRTAIIVQWVQYEWLFGGWSSGHGAITSGLCCVHLPLLPSTAHLYSYQQRYCESLNHFNIHDFLSSCSVSLYICTCTIFIVLNLYWVYFICIIILFVSCHVTKINLEMPCFHYQKWSFLYFWCF